MTKLEDIPENVLNKIKEKAFLDYNVSTVQQLKDAVVDEKFEEIINSYLGEATLRIKRQKMDEYNAYVPTDEEIIAQIQARIDAVPEEIK